LLLDGHPFPNMPFVLYDSGDPETKGDQWVGVFAPAHTPKEVIAVLNREIAKALTYPDVKERFATVGFVPVGNSPEEFAALLKSDTENWSKVIRSGNLKPD